MHYKVHGIFMFIDKNSKYIPSENLYLNITIFKQIVDVQQKFFLRLTFYQIIIEKIASTSFLSLERKTANWRYHF